MFGKKETSHGLDRLPGSLGVNLFSGFERGGWCERGVFGKIHLLLMRRRPRRSVQQHHFHPDFMQVFEGKICPPPEGYIAIAVAKFNRSITQRLLDGAVAKLKEHGTREQDIRIAWTPGAFELPLVADRFASDPDCLAVICLGAVIRGETSHDRHINRAISAEFARLSVATGTPIIFGVLTCNTVEQAIARSGGADAGRDKSQAPVRGNKGAEAAEAALEMIDLFDELPDNSPNPFEAMSDMMRVRLGNDDDDDDWDDEPVPMPPPPRTPGRKKTKKKGE